MRISDWSSDVCSSDLREDQLAVAIHQVDELVDVVPEHRREEGVAELLHQLLRGDFPDGWNTLQCLEHGRGLVAGGQASGTDQRPQRRTAVAAEIGRATCRERVCEYEEISGVTGALKKKR